MSQPPKLKQQSLIKHYLINRELGAGCFGRVYEAIDTKNNNRVVALKCVSKLLAQQSPKAYQLFQAERTILAKIKNENVVGFVDYFENQQVCFLCLEYCNEGDLEIYLNKKPNKRVPENEAVEYYKQILNGFQSLHENNILHRDLKLPNILKHNGQLKIADLGFAKELKGKSLTQTVLGTPYTMAPEVLEEKAYGLPCDIYSLGVNFYQVVFGKYPFNGRSEIELINNIRRQQIDFNVPGVVVSNDLTDLLKRMLQYEVSKRITMDQIWDHPIFSEQKPGANIGMQNLYTSQINPQKKKDFYKNRNQQQVNPFEIKPDSNPIYEESKNDQQGKNVNDIMETYHRNQQIELEIKKTVNYYLNEINTTNQIGKCVDSSHKLPDTQINTFYPVYFMLKKVLHQQTRVYDDMVNQKNIFNCKYPQQLFNNPIFISMRNDLKSRLDTYEAFYLIRKMDMEDLMQQTPNPDIIKELGEQYAANSEKFFKQTLINYYINLQEEMNKWLRLKNTAHAISFQKHIVEVLDCLGLDPFFRSQMNFNFDNYQLFKDNIDFKNRDKLITDKAKVVFPDRR